MEYVYHTKENDDAENSDDPADVAVVTTNVNNDDLPAVEEPTQLNTEAEETESVEESPEPVLRRSSSLRSSLRTVPAPKQLKEEFKLPVESASNSKSSTLPSANTPVFYQLDEKTINRLNKKK